MSLGIYVSVPFCRTKCSYCNFASDVFSRAVFELYVGRVCADIQSAPQVATEMGGRLDRAVDSIYLGGGTPTLLEAVHVGRIFDTLRRQFDISSDAEVTVECAPGTLTEAVIESLLRCGVNRVSLGVQSFVDQEAAAVGRLHKRATVLADIDRLRKAGIENINIDLIAGLPHQTAKSWASSISEAIATAAPHVSVYMLEVDEDSRLGSELLAGGKRYHAHFVPDGDAMADFYLYACNRLQSAAIAQYEISNFAREGFESEHNLKYWTRQPYFGFGVDAHSMLSSGIPDTEAVRFATSDSLDKYVLESKMLRTVVSQAHALEESLFLGLRLSRGVNLLELSRKFGGDVLNDARAAIAKFITMGLIERCGDSVRLTPRGRLLSNEVFEKFLLTDKAVS